MMPGGVAEKGGHAAVQQVAVQQEVTQQEVAQHDPCYPEGLHRVEQPPERICVKGACEVLPTPGLAIVGARKATPYGLNCARRFARLAAARGITVVSGGAIGCDQAAHTGALEAGGRTIVVLGCGADIVYPARGRGLFAQAIAEGGAIVSEAPWGSPPSRWGFRRRNRIIAGIAQATLIVEAGLPSGTFSTADATLAQGKEVLAVPGSIFAQESRGANRLISQGAIPIVDDESFEDALTQIFGLPYAPQCQPWPSAPAASASKHSSAAAGRPAGEDDPRARALFVLAQQPLHVEELLGICGDDVIEVIRCLTSLELA
ncbi:MAG: DNA-processing protein DprA, partial [Coriobacteriales bacterium]|nr:DNA-processing protein DprA [Coriobacteriales bacterium]